MLIILYILFAFVIGLQVGYSIRPRPKHKNTPFGRGMRVLTRYGRVEARVLEVDDSGDFVHVRLSNGSTYWTLSGELRPLPNRWLR